MKASDLAEVLEALAKHDLLDRLGYISNEEIKFFAAPGTNEAREPIDEHRKAEARAAQQAQWERAVASGHVARWSEPTVDAKGDVPTTVKQAIREQRQAVRKSEAG